MNPNINICLSEFYNDGKVVVTNFTIDNNNDYGDIMDILQTCTKKSAYTVYPEYENYVLDYMHGYLHRGYNCYILKREIFYRLCDIQETIIKRLWPKFVKNGMLKQYPRTLAYLAEIIYGIYIILVEVNYEQ